MDYSHCKHEDSQLTQKAISNGRITLRYQCPSCGQSHGAAVARSKVENPQGLPLFDFQLEHTKAEAHRAFQLDQLGSNNNPVLKDISRHGHFPPTKMPIGWDEKGFTKIFPTKDLPFQDVYAVPFSKNSKQENRLIWGDNLAVMRSLPDECLDLIYIDPPFFSGRDYNLIFGDEDERRTFRDIWDGGLQTYLAWLNARIWEMKRLLKSTGSLFVHLDWHASHYVKVELDKIFGYKNFINEIIWWYSGGASQKRSLAKKHDSILYYSKNNKIKVFNADDIRVPYEGTGGYQNSNGIVNNGKRYKPNPLGKIPDDVWRIPIIHPNDKLERIGYPTQKPETLIEKIIKMASAPEDIVGDFFCGGGTTVSVAQKLGRRWVGCDISRVAVQVCSDRIANINKPAGIEIPDRDKSTKFHHCVQYHGTYIKSYLKKQ